ITHEGEITISAAVTGDSVVITVADTGIGIHVERLEDIFYGDNQSAENDDPAYKGSGFGLGIAKKLVELGGGRIWLEPGREIGTAIRFTALIAADTAEEPVSMTLNKAARPAIEFGAKESAAAGEEISRD